MVRFRFNIFIIFIVFNEYYDICDSQLGADQDQLNLDSQIEPIKQPDFVSTRDASEMLGVAVRTVQLWVEKGSLTAWKTAGGHRRIVRKSVEALLARQQAAIDEYSKSRQLTLLVVDDDLVYLELFRLKVKEWALPLAVISVSDGFEGLLRIGECKPDIVVADLRMPGMDGFQMIRRLRGCSATAEILTIVMTGLSDEEIEAKGGLPEDVPVLKKPLLFDELAALIHERTKLAACCQ